jgi:hypothetical protein
MEADSIAYVVRQVDLGLSQHLGHLSCLIVNADNESEDDTRGAFQATETRTPKVHISCGDGGRGKGLNLLGLLQLAHAHRDTLLAMVVLDADLRSIRPDWAALLAAPILDHHDLAAPRYARHRFDDPITDHLCYPLIYSLLETDLRQPVGGEYALSPRLIEHLLQVDWPSAVRQYGIDAFITVRAITGGFSTCEVGLGAKNHAASWPRMGPIFDQVATTLLDQLVVHKGRWDGSPWSRPRALERSGRDLLQPEELTVDLRLVKDQLREEYLPRRELLGELLDEHTAQRVRAMFERDYYDLDLLSWTQIVYRMLHLFDRGSGAVRADVVQALRPLCFARSVAHNYQTWRYSLDHSEASIKSQARAFASQKPFLLGLYLGHGDARHGVT